MGNLSRIEYRVSIDGIYQVDPKYAERSKHDYDWVY